MNGNIFKFNLIYPPSTLKNWIHTADSNRKEKKTRVCMRSYRFSVPLSLDACEVNISFE